MNFFQKIGNFVGFPGIPAGFPSSSRNLSNFEKLILPYDQGLFSLLFIGSVLLHFVLVVMIGVFSEMWVPEPPPIRAKIGVRYAKLPPKRTTPISKTKSTVEKPVMNKLDARLPKKTIKPVSKQPLLKKPVIQDSIKNSSVPKPALSQPEAPRLKMSQPKLKPSLPEKKQASVPKLQKIKIPKKPLLSPPKLSDSIQKLPKVSKDPVPLSPLTSKRSRLSPSQIELPKIEMKNILPRKLSTPKFSKPVEIPVQELPKSMQSFSKEAESPLVKIEPKKLSTPEFSKPKELQFEKLPKKSQPSLPEIPVIAPIKPSVKSETTLEEIFPQEVKIDDNLPDIGILEQDDEQKLNEIPNTSYLQRKKLAQLAGEEYNLHIRTRIIPKLGSYSSNFFVRILLNIDAKGEIIYHEIKESSGSSAFDKAAELAVRNAVLDPLPKALAENPPYIVSIKIQAPQN
ncbi:MAG: hypothetical protein MAG581_01460 [Deltaproteobacteria bacterium]|jgi:TonB family protein|nr:hypothetical protein [Deltaproteobacteria bacterium]